MRTEKEQEQDLFASLAMELGYKACERGMNIQFAQERLQKVFEKKLDPDKFFEGYPGISK